MKNIILEVEISKNDSHENERDTYECKGA